MFPDFLVSMDSSCFSFQQQNFEKNIAIFMYALGDSSKADQLKASLIKSIGLVLRIAASFFCTQQEHTGFQSMVEELMW